MPDRRPQAPTATGGTLPGDLSEPLPAGTKLALAAEILSVYCTARWKLSRAGLRPTLATMREAQPEPQTEASGHSYAQAVRLARAVRRTLALLPADSRCLMQSLVLTGVLAKRGVSSELIIGVQPGTPFRAHAWVEHEGRTVPPGAEASYQRLAQL